jgi:hypothetical protein
MPGSFVKYNLLKISAPKAILIYRVPININFLGERELKAPDARHIEASKYLIRFAGIVI